MHAGLCGLTETELKFSAHINAAYEAAVIANIRTSNVHLTSLFFQIFPDPSDFERCCKLKDRLPSIVVEPTEGDVESGELRWPPEEFVVDEKEASDASVQKEEQ